MLTNGKLNYRPDVDGLRAIAVLSVILFHAGFGCPGGYVGVDVFFVISGFLITSIIWKDLENGRFTFANFWERRARRIAPALIVVTLATLAAGYFLLSPGDLGNLGKAAASQAYFAANRNYFFGTNYFDNNADEIPLLHTWSLAVEEQFYLITPILLGCLFRVKSFRTRSAAITLIITGIAISFPLSVYYVAHQPPFAFYFLSTRAWELLIGSLVAFLPTAPKALDGRAARETTAVVGFAFITIPVLGYTSITPFPGLAALPPCLGTALLLWANGRPGNGYTTLIGKLLSTRPLVFIGLISYSLYLWHWPFLAFGNYCSLMPASPAARGAMLGLGFLLGILSWKYVESPFRNRIMGASRKSMFLFAGAGLLAVFIVGRFYFTMEGFPHRLPKAAREYAYAIRDMKFQYQLTNDDICAGRLVRIGATDPALPPTVLVWGDSHAMAAMPAVDAFLKERGIAGRAATHAATAPVLGWIPDSKWSLGADSVAYNESVVSYIQTQKIHEVILIANWHAYVNSKVHSPLDFGRSLLATVRRLTSLGCHPWIVLDVPQHSVDIPRGVSRLLISNGSVPSYCLKPAEADQYDTIDRKSILAMEDSGARFLDPKPRFLDSTGQYYVVRSSGGVLYCDGDHLSTKGAEIVLLPLFRTLLKPGPR